MKSSTMDKDTIANALSVGSIALTLTDITAIVTLGVLFSAFALNLVRIYYTWKMNKPSKDKEAA